MPISYGNGGNQFAALMPYQNFAQKAAYKQQDALYLNEINRIEEEKMARVNEMQKTIADNAAALAALPVEPQDVDRLRTEIESKTAEALKEMRASGDPESWLRNNGKTVGTDLTRKVLTGDVITNMGVNKASMAKINDDIANGRKVRPIDVTMKDGTVTKLDSQTALDKWRNGEITRIQYQGGYDVPDVGKVMAFVSTNDNPNYSYVKDKNLVTFDQFKDLLSRDPAAKNMSEQELDQHARETYNPSFRWNNNDIEYRNRALNEQINSRRQEAAQKSVSEPSLYQQAYSEPIQRFRSLTSDPKNPVTNIGFNSPNAIRGDAQVYTRLLAANEKSDNGIVNVKTKNNGLWYSEGGINKPITTGTFPSYMFQPNGNLGYNVPLTKGKDNKLYSGTENAIIGGDIFIPSTRFLNKTGKPLGVQETRNRSMVDLAKAINNSLPASNRVNFEEESKKDGFLDAFLQSKGIQVGTDFEKIGSSELLRISGIGVNHTYPRSEEEYNNQSNIANRTKLDEGK